MNRKQALLIAATALGIFGGVLTLIPATSAFGPLVQGGGHLLEHTAGTLLDDCPRSVCACDAKGECGVHGDVGFPDGGASCRCP